MEGSNVARRLAAVLAADVVGYSRLMEVDEAGTLARLKPVRLELIDPAIASCKGRIIKATGDGILVEFQSVTEALRCAVDFQERMARRNRDMSASRALLYRIGINLGDVIVEEDDIFGDGVNLAALHWERPSTLLATPSDASNYRLVPVNEFRKATSACFSWSVKSIGLTRSLLLGL